jgi:hypothetical protein
MHQRVLSVTYNSIIITLLTITKEIAYYTSVYTIYNLLR